MSIHDRNLNKLAIEMCKVKNDLSPLPMQELFINQANRYDLRKKRSWQVPEVTTVANDSETIRYRGPKTLDLLRSEIKNAQTLVQFLKKSKIGSHKDMHADCVSNYTYHYDFV